MTTKVRASILVAALLCGVPSNAWAYRSAAELPAIGSDTPVRWAGQLYGYVVTNRQPTGLSYAAYQQAIDQALSTWTTPDCTSLVVRNLGPVAASAKPGDGLSTIEWVPSGWVARGFDADVPGQTDVAYEQDATGRWFIKEADIYLNGEQNTWDIAGETQSSAWSVRSVILHEGGHAVGLLHPCELVAAVDVPSCGASAEFSGLAMNPIYSATLATLSSDDQAGICSVYPNGLCGDRVCNEAETCTPLGCRIACGDLSCDEGEVCSSGRCTKPGDVPTVAGAAKDAACTESLACQRGLKCISGSCQGGALKLGDLCQKDSQCQDGVCTQDGYCAQACRAAGDCTEIDAVCEEAKGGIGACIGANRSLGSPCDSADECIGRQCLVDGDRAPVCTRLCNAEAAACPKDWQCTEVEGKDVCVTPTMDDGCGCRMAVPADSKQPGLARILVVLGAVVLVLRRGQGGSRRVA